MLTNNEEEFILTRAYVPEHIVSLMVPISKGEAFLMDDYLGFAKDNWLIFVGYPLGEAFSETSCRVAVEKAVGTFKPEYLWFIGPQIPPAVLDGCVERQSDWYYRVDVGAAHPRSLLRQAEKAAAELHVELTRRFTGEHGALISEFLKKEALPPMVRELYRAMPAYLAGSSTVGLLGAYDRKERLSALFVVELAAKEFATYVLGCYSRKHYVAHASDLLFREMIELAGREGKNYISLGLGVNPGIKRFKEKWGGAPFLAYEFCERRYARGKINPKVNPKISLLMRLLQEKL
jgi:hypothetical protein